MKKEALGFIVKIFDKAYETSNILDLAKAPVSAISGVSKSDAEDLKKAFGIDTIRELAENKYVTIAQTTTSLVSLVQVLKVANGL